LVAGLHRLEAVKQLGLDRIKCIFVEGEDIECRLLEITENLHRSELTVAERAEHIAEWIRLTEAKQVSSQVATKPQGGRPESGTRAAARELGVGKDEAHRAVKIASITPAAKEAAKAAGLDDNQSALLKVASYSDDDQVTAVKAIAAERAERQAAPKPKRQPETVILSSDEYRVALDEAEKANAHKAAGSRSSVIALAAVIKDSILDMPLAPAPDLLAAWSAASEGERSEFVGGLGDAIVDALTPAQLHAAHLIHNRNEERARRKARPPEEAERVRDADRARKARMN
jgi:ParB-like chromosome segregation protein Spo0J